METNGFPLLGKEPNTYPEHPILRNKTVAPRFGPTYVGKPVASAAAEKYLVLAGARAGSDIESTPGRHRANGSVMDTGMHLSCFNSLLHE